MAVLSKARHLADASPGSAMSKFMRILLSAILLIGVCVPVVSMNADKAYADAKTVTSIGGQKTWVDDYGWTQHTKNMYFNDGSFAMCCNHFLETPNVGHVYSGGYEVHDSNVRKILYYGYNGPSNVMGSSEVAHVKTSCALNNANYLNQGVDRGDTSRMVQAAWPVYDDLNSKPEPPSYFKVFKWNSGDSAIQDLMTYTYNPNGFAKVKKTSSDPTITNGNPCYDFSGAQFTFKDSAGSSVGTVTANSTGDTNSIELPVGTYKVYETKLPTNGSYGCPHGNASLNGHECYVGDVAVSPQQTASLTVADKPLNDPIAVVLHKADPGLGAGELSGDLPALAGAKYRINYYAQNNVGGSNDLDASKLKASAVFVTNDRGMLKFALGTTVDGTVWPFKDQTGMNLMPVGTYTIQETWAPEGYLVSDQLLIATVVPDINNPAGFRVEKIGDWSQWQTNDADESWAAANEPVIKGGVTVYKYDKDLKSMQAQGDATLVGAKIAVVNESKNPVTVKGQNYDVGEVCDVITTQLTSSNGQPVVFATTGDKVLPYGSYSLHEIDPSTGYLKNDGWNTGVFEIHQDGMIKKFDDYGSGLVEPVKRGGLAVGKVDNETGEYTPLGDTTLANTKFAIKTLSEQPVSVKHEDGTQTVYHKGDIVDVITTQKYEKDGKEVYIAKTLIDALPYGTYQVYEVEPPTGYLPTGQSIWSETFTIRDDGVYNTDVCYSYSEHLDQMSDAANVADFSDNKVRETAHANKNQVYRSDFSFNKISDDQERMANIPFLITSSRGEKHVVVTDENGLFDSKSEWYSHEANTNKNDEAVTWNDDGTYFVDQSKLSPEYGLWFTGSKDFTTSANDAKGAFPYDTYAVEELRCEANTGYQLIKFTATVHRNAVHYDLGTKTDNEVKINTELGYLDSMEDVAPSVGEITLKDVVSYENVNVGTEYKLVGKLHLQNEDGTDAGVATDAAGNEITSEATFTPVKEEGKTEVEFTFDASNLAGKTCTAFEYLYEGDTRVAKHEDIEDVEQTIKFPKISTTATVDGEHEADAAETVTLKDVVKYENLVTGKSYAMTGALHYKNTDGSDGGEVVDENGDPIVSKAHFEAMEPDGEIELEFTFNAKALDMAGKTIVAFESLDRSGVSYAVHTDISDADQTVQFPKIMTSAKDAVDGDQEVGAFKDQKVIDEVSYENVIPGHKYVVKGTLHSSHKDEAGEVVDDGPVSDGNGNPVEAQTEFTAESTSGNVHVEFNFDATGYEGKDFVVFEKLVRDDKQYASHEDITDEGQTIHVPKITTSAVSDVTKDHDGQVDSEVKITDTISYENVTIGHKYAVNGNLMLQDVTEDGSIEESGDIVYSDENNATAASGDAEFVAESTSGSVDIEFTVNAKDLADRTVVVYEEMSNGQQLVAEHKDIADDDQSIHFPDMKTHATDAVDGDQEAYAGAETKIIDTVSYSNLLPGKGYEVNGYMHVTDSAGNDLGLLQSDGTVFNEELQQIVSIADSEKYVISGEKPGSIESDQEEHQYLIQPGTYSTGTYDGSSSGIDKTALIGGTYKASLIDPGLIAKVEVSSLNDVDNLMVANAIYLSSCSEDAELHGEYENASSEATVNVPVDGLISIEVTKIEDTGQNVREAVLFNGYMSAVEMGEDNYPVSTVRGSAQFVPESPDGEVQVEFVFNASTLAGYSTVVFEDLYKNDVKLVSHADITDKDQTITFPKIGTELTADGKHDVEANGDVTLVDTIKYDGLESGKEYQVDGVLHVVDAEGNDLGILLNDGTAGQINEETGELPENAVISTDKFTPDAMSGETTVEFKFNAKGLGDKSVVAFEKLSTNGSLVASHEDIADKNQTVKFLVPPAPQETMPPLGRSILFGLIAIAGVTIVGASAYKLHTSRRSQNSRS